MCLIRPTHDGFQFDGAFPSCPAKSFVEQRQMLGELKWIGGANVRLREIRLEMQERLQRSPCFRFPRRVPKRGHQPLEGTNVLWLSVDRVCCRSNSTIDIAKQKARERQVGEDQRPRLVLWIELQNGLQGRYRLRGAPGKDGGAPQELVRDDR